MNEEEQNIEALLLDVIRGYSKVQSNNQTFYLKHFLVYESLQLEEFQQEALNEAIKKGIKSEKEIIEDAIKRGHWSVKEEESIKSIRWMIEKSESAASKITDNIARKSFEASISKQREELQELQSRRDSLTAHSADNLAKRKKYTKK
jgi:protein required for attachment to host cells